MRAFLLCAAILGLAASWPRLARASEEWVSVLTLSDGDGITHSEGRRWRELRSL